MSHPDDEDEQDRKKHPWAQEYANAKTGEPGLWHWRIGKVLPEGGNLLWGWMEVALCGQTFGTVSVSEFDPKELHASKHHKKVCRMCRRLLLLSPLIEMMAKSAHEAWMLVNKMWGITSRKAEWGEEFMVPYEELSERGKELDRTIMRAILVAFSKNGYSVLRRRRLS